MDPEVLAWAQVLAREMVGRDHPSLQLSLMVNLIQSNPTTRAQFDNYFSTAPPQILNKMSLCRLYAGVGLLDELKETLRGLPLSNGDVIAITSAAARGGHWPVLELFFRHAHYRNSSDVVYQTLQQAVQGGQLEIVALMIDYKLKPCAASSLAKEAAQAGQAEILKLLLPKADLQGQCINRLLMAAVESTRAEVVALVLALKPSPSPWAIDDAAQRACSINGQTTAVIDAFVNFQPQLLNRLLIKACEAGKLELTQHLLDRGASNLNDALKVCYERRRLEVVELLVSRGAQDPDGYLAVHGGEEVATLLLRAGATNADHALLQDSIYFMPHILRLVLAAGPSNLEVALLKGLRMLRLYPSSAGAVLLLLEAGASNVESALVEGARYGAAAVVELALTKGACQYKQALEAAAQGGHRSMVKLLARRAGVVPESFLAKALAVQRRKQRSPIYRQVDIDDY